MPENKKIKKILANLPQTPGIYKMIDRERKIIYIGKAKDIKKRVKQYFQKDYQHSSRTKKLIENVTDIETIGVDSELEAMILETNLIKQFQPRYNILMKDDKNYVYIKITNEDFPQIQIVRKIEKDGAKYIGPKTAAHKIKDTFKFLKKIFPFRHCTLGIESLGGEKVKITKKTIKYPCLDYYIKRCAAPCIEKCSKEEYSRIIQNVENFLEGKGENILKTLKEQMQDYAIQKKFEKAAKIRDKIKKIKEILEKQKVDDHTQEDKDIINYCTTHGRAYFNLFQIRDGKLIGQENFILQSHSEAEAQKLKAEDTVNPESQEILSSFLKQYYSIALDIPPEILIPHEAEKIPKIKMTIPQKGTKNKLLEMSLKNAQIFADRNKPSWQEESELTKKAAEKLQELLKIREPLKRIECYDISHLSGTSTVGSMIVFEKGVPKKDHYRKFQIRTVIGKPDDYQSMGEVLLRRFSKISREIQYKDYKFRKAGKKNKLFIEKHNKVNFDKEKKPFYVLEKNKKTVGFVSIDEHSDKVSEIRNLWLHKKERGKKLGYKILKEIIAKAKAKRVYAICKKELKDYYALFGFEEIKKIPEELEERYKYLTKKFDTAFPMVYDKNKHKPDKSFNQIPNLVIVDGGKGQLGVAEKIFNELNLQIPHVALAKQLEEIHCPGLTNPIILTSNNEALKLLQRARDEAHRFAISYNRNLRERDLRNGLK